MGAIGSAYQSGGTTGRRLAGSATDSGDMSREITNSVGSLVLSSMVAGEAPVVSSLPSLKMTTQVNEISSGEDLRVFIPQSELEEAYYAPISSVAINMSGAGRMTLATSITESKAFIFGARASNFTANPINIVVNADDSRETEVIVIYHNIVPVRYILPNSTDFNVNVSSSCLQGESNFTVLSCPEDVQIVHQCNGTAGALVTMCPEVQIFPLCHTISADGDSDICVVVNHTNVSTTCKCTLAVGSGSRRRRLDAEEGVRSFQAVAIISTIIADVHTDLKAAPTSVAELPAIFARTIIVIVMFVALWCAGFTVIGYFKKRDGELKTKSGKAAILPAPEEAVNSVTNGPAEAHRVPAEDRSARMHQSIAALRVYVKMLIPPVSVRKQFNY